MALSHFLLKFQCFLLLAWMHSASAEIPSNPSEVIAIPGCQDQCGGLNIPYPFGIGEGCFQDKPFEINCTNNEPKNGHLRVSNISVLEAQVTFENEIYSTCSSVETYLSVAYFTISSTKNKLIFIGCDTWVYLNNVSYVGDQGCSDCNRKKDIIDGSCNGMGCCEASIPFGLRKYNMTVERKIPKNLSYNPCSYAFVGEESSFRFSSSYLQDFKNNGTGTFPVVADWTIGSKTCDEAKDLAICGPNTECKPGNNIDVGYLCKCRDGYEGNPYLNISSAGYCQDINECDRKEYDKRCERQGNFCKNTIGAYTCPCQDGFNTSYVGKDGISDCISSSRATSNNKIVIGVCLGLVLLVVSLVVGFWLYWGHRKRKHMKVKEEFFKQNGGLILNRLLDEREDDIEASGRGRGGSKHRSIATIYTEKELSKASNNYHETQILGRGGFGTVYKGTLANGTVVAIKKTKFVDRNQNEQFINEISVLSQINHKNVVQLLGCCLESEVPLLVYEYVTNGTLYQHLHQGRENQTGSGNLSWENRLRIAMEVAGALAYLHSEASIPIIHRDVKSSNVLLDDDYKAKVSDFGASRLIPREQAQLSTVVQGTLGYLDPEYMLSNQLTEKSDVYSFGVLLVELLTGEAVFSPDRIEEERNLAYYFLAAMKTNRLLAILDGNMVWSDTDNERISCSVDEHQQIQQTAELAQKCLRTKGDNRPTMKEVAIVLHGLTMVSSSKHAVMDDEDQISNTRREAHMLLLESADSISYTDSTTTNGDSITGISALQTEGR